MKPLTPTVLLSLLGVALAQGTSPLTLDYSQSLVRTVTVDGKSSEQRTPNYVKVRPGDLLAQTVVARNVSSRTLKNIVVRLPVPTGMVYQGPDGGTQTGVRTEYSIDGGKTYAASPTKKVTVTENGKSVTKDVEAKPNEYQAVRWLISEMKAGSEMKVSFRAQVK
ncbi:hypothetical protein [Deinococcus hopiensis]|uniref:Conserved repeat domain-containing protein n=1 Tax=Deinococcus hopiensis KR-140 TaxID=695939 RepID=A0A1W1UX68_9DEIO|nr:hypothetical protein [Deinococcus hopiensis]SMB85599.1 conserved repeat domain-containing protein [Deinococcus hopiensis KR-140]